MAVLAMHAVTVHASPEARVTADLVYELGEAKLETAGYILRAAVDVVARNPEIKAIAGHSAFSAILNGSESFRSLLAIDANGTLQFDSFNPIPYRQASDLSDREYFLATTAEEPMKLRINAPVVGRQSGEVFIPLTMAVPSPNKTANPIVALVTPPSTLMPSIDICVLCGIALAFNGKIIASSRPMSDVNEVALSRLEFRGTYGAVQIEVRGIDVLVHWRRSTKTGVVYLFYQSGPLATE
ncbi:MAG: hypothetical protein AAGH90_10650 [Pseudomonadota bacterium]